MAGDIKNLTTKDLIDMLFPVVEVRPVEETTRYVLYARKSSESNEKQVKSLDDQIGECLELARKLNLNVAHIIREEKSAKMPNNRPEFRQMLDDIKRGRYTGILAWHPDRVSRNMKEAGECIDMLDSGIIKDLKFVSFMFENSPSGKMLLGLTFVMAKEYSDKLSTDVKRGNMRRVAEGKTLNVAKYGYFRDKDFWQKPDGNNFELIKKAWQMRREGEPLEVIADFLNSTDFTVCKIKEQKHRVKYHFDKKNLSLMFRDPFYAGVFKHGKNYADLVELQPDFVPMITVDDFVQINLSIIKGGKGYRSLVRVRNKPDANLARGIILCGYCGQAYSSGLTGKRLKDGTFNKIYYYRCENPQCEKYNKSERAKVMVDGAYEVLKSIKVMAEKALYEHYQQEMGKVIAQRTRELETRRRGLQTAKSNQEKHLADIKALLVNADKEGDKELKAVYRGDVEKYQENIKAIEKELSEIEQTKVENKELIFSYEKFLERFNNLASELENKPTIEKLDFVIRKVFLNLTLKDHQLLSYELNSPFKEFEEKGFVSIGRGART